VAEKLALTEGEGRGGKRKGERMGGQIAPQLFQ